MFYDAGVSSYTKDIDTLVKSIENSLKVISVWDKDTLVGLIRVIGDRYSIIYIQDILVLQRYQNKGIGKKLISIINKEYESIRQKVFLTDNQDQTVEFYKKCGFNLSQDFGCVAFVKFNH